MLSLLDDLVKHWMDRSMPQLLPNNYTRTFQHNLETTGTFIPATLNLSMEDTTKQSDITGSIQNEEAQAR